MKTARIILAGLLFSALAGTAGAQNNDNNEGDGKFGVKGGLNLSNLYIDEVDDENVKEGYHFGLYTKVPVIEDFLSVQPELLYSSKGAETKYMRSGNEVKIDYDLKYVDLPVMLRVDIGGVNIQAGGYASYLLNAKVEQEINDGPNEQEFEMNEDNFATFDYGLAAGLGFEWRAVDAGVRYNYGLRDVGNQDNQAGAGSFDPLRNGRNSVAQIYLGIGF